MAETLTKYDEEWLRKNVKVGIRGVDRSDVQPPQILLIQKSSNLPDFVDTEGENPKVGQFFHTGKMKIYDTIDCYIIFAAKKTYMDRRNDPPEQKDQYITFGLLKDGLGLFGMKFKSTAFYALSSLFTAVMSQNTPMFAFNIKIETKELQGDQGSWHVPAIRVGDVEKDQEVLNKLHKIAVKFDEETENYQAKEDEDADVEEPKQKPADAKEFLAPTDPVNSPKTNPSNKADDDSIDPDDIPF